MSHFLERRAQGGSRLTLLACPTNRDVCGTLFNLLHTFPSKLHLLYLIFFFFKQIPLVWMSAFWKLFTLLLKFMSFFLFWFPTNSCVSKSWKASPPHPHSKDYLQVAYFPMIPRRSSGAHRANERQTLAPVFKKKKKKEGGSNGSASFRPLSARCAQVVSSSAAVNAASSPSLYMLYCTRRGHIHPIQVAPGGWRWWRWGEVVREGERDRESKRERSVAPIKASDWYNWVISALRERHLLALS